MAKPQSILSLFPTGLQGREGTCEVCGSSEIPVAHLSVMGDPVFVCAPCLNLTAKTIEHILTEWSSGRLE